MLVTVSIGFVARYMHRLLGRLYSGQAWAIMGFIEAYTWTNERAFLDTAISLANYFIQRLSSMAVPYNYVPSWDFDAPLEPDGDILRDTSAGVIAVGLVAS